MITKNFYCWEQIAGEKRIFSSGNYVVDLIHYSEDPDNANRIRVKAGKTLLEILPSKGFSLAQAWIDDKELFWDAPIGLPDTETIDLYSNEVWINGNPAPGFTFLKTFCGGLELYGLKNWGMPIEKEGALLPLHGETSNVPVENAVLMYHGDMFRIEGSFIYRDFTMSAEKPWHQQGEGLFRVTVSYVLNAATKSFRSIFNLENISGTFLTPDWGFHITLRPEPGSRLSIPSLHVEERSGATLPDDIETWHPAGSDKVRTETGIIHKEIQIIAGQEIDQRCALQVYPSGNGTLVQFPASPYVQSWFCNGGANSTEFTTNGPKTPLFHKNWDGQGIEIGVSSLDHNGNKDDSVDYNGKLAPGEKKVIQLNFSVCDQVETRALLDKITKITKERLKA
jgi:hypothetical protein